MKNNLKEFRPSDETIIKVIDKLNDRISSKYEKIGCDQEFRIFYTTDGYHKWVGWDTLILWDNFGHDDRKYDEDHDLYESFDKYIIRRFNEEMSNFNKLKL